MADFKAEYPIPDCLAPAAIETKTEAAGVTAYRTKCVSTLGASAQVDAPFSAV